MKTVSIGIPAYNEAANIEHVVRSMLSQRTDEFVITKIVVASDGSTDATAQIVRSISNEQVVLLDDRVRRGKNYRQNQLLSMTDTDILVLVDADIRFNDVDAIAKLTAPIRTGVADFTGQWAIPDTSRTFLEAVQIAGHEFKQSVYRALHDGHNMYTCVGHMRAFAKPLYEQLRFNELDSGGEDQFSYLQSVKLGFRYNTSAPIVAYFKLPSTMDDYMRYARRVIATQHKFSEEIGSEIVTRERAIPKLLIIKKLLKNIAIHPIKLSCFLLLHVWVSNKPYKTPEQKPFFEVSESTK